jgi:hypothetical protein
MKLAMWMIAMFVSSVLSWVGWRATAGHGIFAAYVASTLAGGYGLYLGRRLARRLLD